MNIQLPVRVARTYRQRLVAPPDEVFPLLCPVREADWIDGWNPSLVITGSGAGEQDCVFLTGSADGDAIWYIVARSAEQHRLELIKITPGVTACRCTIQLRAAEGGSEADVTYMHTSLGPRGDAFVEAFTEASYLAFMREWERRLNHYLTTGKILKAG